MIKLYSTKQFMSKILFDHSRDQTGNSNDYWNGYSSHPCYDCPHYSRDIKALVKESCDYGIMAKHNCYFNSYCTTQMNRMNFHTCVEYMAFLIALQLLDKHNKTKLITKEKRRTTDESN